MEQRQWHRAIVAMGSNSAEAESLLDITLSELSAKGISLAQSTRRLWTEPFASEGITSDSHKFLNCLVAIETTLAFDELSTILKEVERRLGATKADKRKGIVVVDLDILSYDGERHHLDDWQRNYIQTLIQELQ